MLLPIYEIKENLFVGLKNYIHYWRNYVTGGSVIAGCDCSCCMNSRCLGCCIVVVVVDVVDVGVFVVNVVDVVIVVNVVVYLPRLY